MKLLFISSVISFSIVLFCHESRAQEDSAAGQARIFYENGIELYEQGDAQAAAGAFREAYRLRPSWKILFNIGQCEAAAGRYGLAMEAFQQYLVDGRDDIPLERKDYVAAEILRLQALVGELNVEAPEGSTVMVDGVIRGKTPLTGPVIVVAGVDHEVVVIRRDKRLLEQTFKVWASRTHEIKVPEQSAAEKSGTGPGEEENDSVDNPVADEDSGGLNQIFFWSGVGATAAFGAVTIAMELVVMDRREQYNDKPEKDLYYEVEIMQTTGITFLALTGAAAVATGVLAVFTDFSGEIGEIGKGGRISGRALMSPWFGQDSGGLSIVSWW